MTVKVALVISDKNYRASPSGKGSIRKVQTEICYNFEAVKNLVSLESESF